ncbi:bifunctional uridylate/adenylate kinase Ecym_5638 [Eremothecium cymbalariae DBVPG|uniref:Uridylate kinase n=1 Tax=Eremothecium cymbalariae (strain CBS 270.75 / DBVPG 7215 / KCTC 17166 / NRRL Y-17582) TaxID=931890 RepID=I6NE82_ERECY|nr:hypothetical protein Ecym_5638 [Eremothecium cymbalariae DBVPG\
MFRTSRSRIIAQNKVVSCKLSSMCVPLRASFLIHRRKMKIPTGRFFSSTPNSEKSDPSKGKYRGTILTLLGALAIGSTLFSIGYQRSSPKELLEDNEHTGDSPGNLAQDVSVIFVLGGPGAGKGTQCARLVEKLGFVHVGAGDLLRDEQNRPGSQYGDLIKDYIKEGLIVPQEITVALLKRAIEESYKKGKKNFLVDGFPRKMDQAITFEKEVTPSKFVLFFDCPEKVMLERLLVRSQTSGRTDDNIESIKKRFKTFIDTSLPVVEYFEAQDRVVKIRCDQPVDQVYNHVENEVSRRLGVK